ncbi:MAG: hypothetical protein GXP37_14820 [Chloroflexi bacterium]|nr:hypothetical protein [Chloroflexota bacterium]
MTERTVVAHGRRVGKKKQSARQRRGQLVLVGGGIGLYLGLFFEPLREPSLSLMLELAFLIAVVMTFLRWLRGERPPLAGLLRYGVMSFVKFGFVLAALEGRHLAYDVGGRLAVIVMTTFLGVVAGVWTARSDFG